MKRTLIQNNRNWKTACARTITMESSFATWEEFVTESGIDSTNETYEQVFNLIYNLYSDTDAIDNTTEYFAQRLKFAIEVEVDRYEKSSAIWDGQIEKLWGQYEEINQFSMADITEDPENFDNYKTARQTKIQSDNLLDRIKELELMKTPIENLVERIVDKVFMSVIPETIL